MVIYDPSNDQEPCPINDYYQECPYSLCKNSVCSWGAMVLCNSWLILIFPLLLQDNFGIFLSQLSSLPQVPKTLTF